MSNGIVVNKEPIAALIKLEGNEDLKTCFKLTENHITVEKTQRQNVRKASQLLSHSTAAALKLNFPHDTKALVTIDLMNTYKPNQYGQSFQKGYGQDLCDQDNILTNMLNVIRTMRCCGKNNLQLFQKGCIISILSLQELFKDLRSTYNISYILTHRLNQDSLENLFSQIRTRGGLNDHPSPLEALYRIRMIVLGKTQGVLQSNTNTNNEDDTSEFVVSKVLKVTGVQFPEENEIEEEKTDYELLCEQPTDVGPASDLKENALEYLSGNVKRY